MTGAVAAALFGATVGTDVVPNPLDWADIYGDTVAENTDLTITGITAPTTLKVTYTGAGNVLYVLNSGAGTVIASGGTLVVNNGDTLHWRVYTVTVEVSGVITVVNHSNGDSPVDTMNYDVTFYP